MKINFSKNILTEKDLKDRNDIITKCKRCKDIVPFMKIFKIGKNSVCEKCYKELTDLEM